MRQTVIYRAEPVYLFLIALQHAEAVTQTTWAKGEVPLHT